ncbi:MAG: M48 family metalloprotease [Candidatus Micrarchaeota archaeon]
MNWSVYCLMQCVTKPESLLLIGGSFVLSYLAYKSRGRFKTYGARVGALYLSVFLSAFPLTFVLATMACDMNFIRQLALALPLSALVVSALFYFFGGRLFLLATGAREMKKEDAPHLFSALASEGARAKLAFIDSAEELAFSITARESYVVFSVGILESLNEKEQLLVLGHELRHIRRLDPLSKLLMGALALFSPTGMLNRAALSALAEEQEREK